MFRYIRTFTKGVRDFEQRRATDRMLRNLDERILRDIGLEDWQSRR